MPTSDSSIDLFGNHKYFNFIIQCEHKGNGNHVSPGEIRDVKQSTY